MIYFLLCFAALLILLITATAAIKEDVSVVTFFMTIILIITSICMGSINAEDNIANKLSKGEIVVIQPSLTSKPNRKYTIGIVAIEEETFIKVEK